ncbi:hypothetical protein FG379_002462 [Cryptosporidium bovis]|uniref:uncharacterized protein n=1 Tax=Cryptosporidium bovis TaxID=310047 RepID=UPI00351A76D2|nr:hypothetical protein FG379_002462 [Cryptosporidium bovis]
MTPNIKALSDVLEYIRNNYCDLVKVIQEEIEENKIIIKIQILNKSKENLNSDVTNDEFLKLEISILGIRELNESDSASYYETIESLFQSVVPDTWFRYFESKIMNT